MALTKVSRGLLSTSIVDNGNATAITIDSSENVGIGTSSPSAPLHVNGGGTGSVIIDGTDSVRPSIDSSLITISGGNATNSGANYSMFGGSHASLADVHRWRTGGTERMRIDSSGNVGIGTSSPTFSSGSFGGLHVHGSSGTSLRMTNAASGQTASDGYEILLDPTSKDTLYVNRESANQRFYTGGTERMRIDSSGRLLVGTTGTVYSERFLVRNSGASYTSTFIADSGATAPLILRNANGVSGTRGQTYFYYDGTFVGSITSTSTSTAYNTSSDYRLKENIADADDAGSKIDAIQVRQYDWKADGSHQDYGMIAQELQTVAPEAVSGDADSEEMMGVDYSKLVPMLIKEIQSLRNRVAQLEE